MGYLTNTEETPRYYAKDGGRMVVWSRGERDFGDEFIEVSFVDYTFLREQILAEQAKRIAEDTERIAAAIKAAKETKINALIEAGIPEAAAHIMVGDA